MTRQEMFETAVLKMWEQKSYSTANGKCSYISDGGKNRCAFGHLLTETEAKAAVEFPAISKIGDIAPKVIEELGLERFFGEEEFCADLQHYLHDRMVSLTFPNIFNNMRIFDSKAFLGMAHALGKKYDLDVNFLDNLKK